MQSIPHYSLDQISRHYPPTETYGTLPAASAPRPPSLNLGLASGIDLTQSINALRAGDHWHDNMVRVVASLVAKGRMDAEIEAMALGWTLPGYTHDQTLEEVRQAVQGARTKWNVPQPVSHDYGPLPNGLTLEQSVVYPERLAGKMPPMRDWFVPSLIPAGKVVLFTGDGGLGKSLLVQQLMTACATGTDWLGLSVKKGRAFALFCEDDNDELHRRQADINTSLGIGFDALTDMAWVSGVGQDNVLMAFPNGSQVSGVMTPRFEGLIAFLRSYRPALVIIDTLADTFGGNEIVRGQVRNFINSCLGRICEETGSTVILCGHPSQMGKTTGEGFSGSTAWHNSVRARLYLTRPKGDDKSASDERMLSTMKNNYGPSDGEVTVEWRNGIFEVLRPFVGSAEPTDRGSAEDAFIRALRSIQAQGRRVSDSRNAGNYAPKVLTSCREGQAFKVGELEKAMYGLLDQGRIEMVEDGPPSKRQRSLVEVSL